MSYSRRSHVHIRIQWHIQWVRQAAGSYKQACVESKVTVRVEKGRAVVLFIAKYEHKSCKRIHHHTVYSA